MSNIEDHMAEQDAITAACDAGACGHPECHDLSKIQLAAAELGASKAVWMNAEASHQWLVNREDLPLSVWRIADEYRADRNEEIARDGFTLEDLKLAFRTGFASHAEGQDENDAWDEHREFLRVCKAARNSA